MTTLDYATLATNLFSIAIGLRLAVRPDTMGWSLRTTRFVGATMALLALIVVVLIFTQSHGKA